MSSQLSLLVNLIANATKVVEAQFSKSTQPDVPSLNDTATHPLDEVSSMELKEAVQIIEGSCAQLCAMVARPSHTVLNKMFGIFEPACMNVVVTFKIPDILQEKPSGMHISELSKKSGVEQSKLGRIMRLLATKHCFCEVDYDVFANNRISVQLLSSSGLSSLTLHVTDEGIKSASVLADTLADSNWGQSFSPQHTSFNMWSKYPGPIFAYFEGVDTDVGAAKGARFGRAMQGWGEGTEAASIVTDFPWNSLPSGASVCDVGGGVGHVTMQLAKVHPHLQLILQDLPQTIAQAEKDVWPKQCPEAIVHQKIQFKPLNFLVESPVKGCDVYYLKNTIHTSPEKECIKILSGVKAAMGPKSRVLIHEYILQHVNRVADTASLIKQAPEPLLPNYGVGRIRQYNLDINVMCLANSQERYLEDFIRLGEASGLKFVKVWDLKEMGLIEFCA